MPFTWSWDLANWIGSNHSDALYDLLGLLTAQILLTESFHDLTSNHNRLHLQYPLHLEQNHEEVWQYRVETILLHVLFDWTMHHREAHCSSSSWIRCGNYVHLEWGVYGIHNRSELMSEQSRPTYELVHIHSCDFRVTMHGRHLLHLQALSVHRIEVQWRMPSKCSIPVNIKRHLWRTSRRRFDWDEAYDIIHLK